MLLSEPNINRKKQKFPGFGSRNACLCNRSVDFFAEKERMEMTRAPLDWMKRGNAGCGSYGRWETGNGMEAVRELIRSE